MIDWILGAAEGVAEATSNAIATVISYLIAACMQIALVLLQALPQFGFAFTEADVASFMGVAVAWQAFVPVIECAVMCFFALSFAVGYGVVRFLISLIPTVG